MSSIPPPKIVMPWVSVNPQPLAPLQPLPEHIVFPDLPGPPRNPAFNSTHSVTTHIIPAAYPRNPSSVWIRPPLGAETQEQRDARVQKTIETISARKYAQERGEAVGEKRGEVLWNTVNRYFRTKPLPGRGITLLLFHGVGTPKEVRRDDEPS